MYIVKLSSYGNIDFGQDPNQPLPNCPNREVAVENFPEASVICRGYIEKYNLGGGNWSGGQVYKNGKQVAYISYNGRIWNKGDAYYLEG